MRLLELACSDCFTAYYILPQYAREDSGRCAQCDNDIAYLEEHFGPPPVALPSIADVRAITGINDAAPEVRRDLRESERQAFLGMVGALVFAGFAWWGIISAARYLWSVL